MKKYLLIFALSLSRMALAEASGNSAVASQWSAPLATTQVTQLSPLSALKPNAGYGASLAVPANSTWLALIANGQQGQGSAVRGYQIICFLNFTAASFPRTLRLKDGFFLTSVSTEDTATLLFTVKPTTPDDDEQTVNETISSFECGAFREGQSAAVMTLPELNCLMTPWIAVPQNAQRHPYLACPVQRLAMPNKPLLAVASGDATGPLYGAENLEPIQFNAPASPLSTPTADAPSYTPPSYDPSTDRYSSATNYPPMGYGDEGSRVSGGGGDYQGYEAERGWVNRNFPLTNSRR